MANITHSEIELLKESIQGNTAAFESIVKKYQSFVCAITFSAIPDVEKSEDMAQETFLHVWNNLSQLKDLQKFRSWLISITRNIINDSLRKQKRDLINKAASIKEIEDKRASKSEPDRKASIKEQQTVVQNALMEIPEKYREPLVLFYRQEKSVKNIAEQLELSEETVKQHLSRGRKLLREQVAAMVENTISKSGPTSIFTSAVMVSIIGAAVTGSGAAVAAAATLPSTTAGAATVMSGITAKIIATAAVVAIGIGTVVTYKHLTRPEQKSQTPVAVSPAGEVENRSDSDNISSALSMDTETIPIQDSTQDDNISAVNAGQDNTENTANSNQNTALSGSITNTPVIALKNKPNSSPYEYFLFSRYDQVLSTRTLVLAHVTDNGIELKDIETDDFGSFRWNDPICVTEGKLYSIRVGDLYSIDLKTKQSEHLSSGSRNDNAKIINYGTFNPFGCHADNCLYGFAETSDAKILRQLDFEKGAYRNIAVVNSAPTQNFIAVSPDHKRLAYFATRPGDVTYPSTNRDGYFLTIVDIETGEITQPAEPIDFMVAGIASSFPGIPIIWLDSETVAFVRTEVPEGEDQLDFDTSAVHMLSMSNVNTGRMEDILSLPGNPYMRFAPDLIQDSVGIGPRVYIKHEEHGDYRLDLKNRKLVEDDLIAGDYRIAFGHLYYKDQDLGPAERRYINVSADGKRIMWMSDEPVISNNAQDREAAYRAAMNSNNTLLFYHDEAQEAPIAIARIYNSVGLWLKPEDLQAHATAANLSAEWTPLKNIANNTTTQQYVETRKNIRDYLTCEIKTDKNTYLLHEPIHVTLTLTNKSSSDINIKKPYVIDSVIRPLTGLSLNYPGGQKSFDRGAQPYSPDDEEILLKAGESVISTDTIEINTIGNYSLEHRYKMNVLKQEYIGSITTEPAAFQIVANENAQQNQNLFEAKFTRLMDKFHREIEMDPNWFGANNTVGDEITGMPGMGPKLAPYLIEAIENEKHEKSRKLLFRALASVAGPEHLPFFKERLINVEDDTEQICSWMLNTYRNSGTDENIREQAIDSLILGMSVKSVEDRREVCSCLTKIYDKNIESCFAKAVDDENEQIRLDAGFYLAAAEWLELAEWLKLAGSEPTYARYIGVSAVIIKLEKQWNISKGELPFLTEEDFANTDPLPEQYFQVIGDWQSWADENPRASFLFFEEYRQKWWENDPLRQE